MRIQFLNGGLANQVFQYIFARYYELATGNIMYMDDSYFALYTEHNGYELEKVFGIKPHMLSECFDEDVWDFMLQERRQGKSIPTIFCENGIEIYMMTEVVEAYKMFNPFDGVVLHTPCNMYHPEILELPENIYYHGFWINKNWFATYQEQFMKEFCFPEITDSKNKAYMDKILQTKSVSIHIRRGDFVTLGWNYSAEDYFKMLQCFAEQVPGKWELFVFSDDIPWCKEHRKELGFQLFDDVTYIEGNGGGRTISICSL